MVVVMFRRDFLKLAGLVLVPFKAAWGALAPSRLKGVVPSVPDWQILYQQVGGWDCTARYRIWPKCTPESDHQISISWYRMILDKERYPETPPPVLEVDCDAGLVRFREMTPEELAEYKPPLGRPVESIVEDFSGSFLGLGCMAGQGER